MSEGDEETEEREAAIIRHVNRPGYGHIENILHILEHYKSQMPHRDAVARLHSEVCEE